MVRRAWALVLTTAAIAAIYLVSVNPTPAIAARFCGKFHVSGLLTTVQVYGNNYVTCRQAKSVMRRRFAGNTPAGWHCIGPQTGYALCTKSRKRVSAHF